LRGSRKKEGKMGHGGEETGRPVVFPSSFTRAARKEKKESTGEKAGSALRFHL